MGLPHGEMLSTFPTGIDGCDWSPEILNYTSERTSAHASFDPRGLSSTRLTHKSITRTNLVVNTANGDARPGARDSISDAEFTNDQAGLERGR